MKFHSSSTILSKSLTFASAGCLLFISIIEFFYVTIDPRIVAVRIALIFFTIKILLCEFDMKWT